ncbi:MAG: hypothetical protein QOG49_1797 [Frankiaceae bacterium]|nr:hypothetical protein [Frankiaceae bacterium]
MPANTAAVAPIEVAWVSTGGTGAPNYDEFNSYDEVTRLIESRPGTILPVDMPHCTPADRAAGTSFLAALPAARERLAGLKAAGSYSEQRDVLVAYRISGPRGAAYGVYAMVATGEISDSADAPGRVIRNEDVFIDKVRERTAHLEALQHIVSPVLLLASGTADSLDAALRAFVAAAGPAYGADADEHGLLHEIWVMPAGPDRASVLGLLNDTELVVADGNHRSLAAQTAGIERFLAVVTTQHSVRIEPYNRLLRRLPVAADELLAGLEPAGFDVRPADRDVHAGEPGDPIELHLADGRAFELRAKDPEGSVVDRMDHTIVERRIFGDLLALDPGAPDIAYVGGETGVELLRSELSSGAAAAAITIAPVTVDTFVEVNLERLKMPRKSTWFTPKARSGLVVVDVSRDA